MVHSDRGVQYTSIRYSERLEQAGAAPSVGSRGDCLFTGCEAQISQLHSNDNPYSESQFKTMKYCPAFPERFGSIQDARAFCETFFSYYNHDHRHSGIGYHTPASVHYCTATEVREQGRETLAGAYAANPARFRHRQPEPPALPSVVWINEPIAQTDEPGQKAS